MKTPLTRTRVMARLLRGLHAVGDKYPFKDVATRYKQGVWNATLLTHPAKESSPGYDASNALVAAENILACVALGTVEDQCRPRDPREALVNAERLVENANEVEALAKLLPTLAAWMREESSRLRAKAADARNGGAQ